MEGGRVWWGEREITYLSRHCHHTNDSCIKMGSDASHLRDKVTRQYPQTTKPFFIFYYGRGTQDGHRSGLSSVTL